MVINTEGKNAGGVTYNDELVGFVGVNNKFLPSVEKVFPFQPDDHL